MGEFGPGDTVLRGPALLFCPGDRPDRFRKALHSGVDEVILDLEDGVSEDRKEAARAHVVDFIRSVGPARLIVRINDPLSKLGQADLAALVDCAPSGLLVPKVESREQLRYVSEAMASPALHPKLGALIESARGVMALQEIAADPGLGALTWGPYDLAADMGVRALRQLDGRYAEPFVTIRSLVLVAAAAYRLTAIDTVTPEIQDLDMVRRDTAEAARLGFTAKLAIHPSHVGVIQEELVTKSAEIERARRLLAEASRQGQGGAFMFEGSMVDRPMLERARRLLAQPVSRNFS